MAVAIKVNSTLDVKTVIDILVIRYILTIVRSNIGNLVYCKFLPCFPKIVILGKQGISTFWSS